jgi:hypothetical protein
VAVLLDSGTRTGNERGGLTGGGVDDGSSRDRRRGFVSVWRSGVVVLGYLHARVEEQGEVAPDMAVQRRTRRHTRSPERERERERERGGGTALSPDLQRPGWELLDSGAVTATCGRWQNGVRTAGTAKTTPMARSYRTRTAVAFGPARSGRPGL